MGSMAGFVGPRFILQGGKGSKNSGNMDRKASGKRINPEMLMTSDTEALVQEGS